MSITVTCPTCYQAHAVVPAQLVAHPGHTNTDGRWVSAGRSQPLQRSVVVTDDGTLTRSAWPCTCGEELTHYEPAYDVTPCLHGHPDGCRVHARNTRPPLDVHVNPRHGAACPCCGQQGTHLVRVDREGPLPACLTP